MDNMDHALQLLRAIDARLQLLEQRSQGSSAVYVGNGRVLLRTDFLRLPDRGPRLLYLVEGNDRVLVPRFIADGIFEPSVTNYFMSHVGIDSHCLDVGANFGYYSCLLGRIALRGKTVAVEANPTIYSLLVDNIHINWLGGHVKPINVAAGEKDGTLTLYRRLTRASNTSIIKIPDEDLVQYGEPPSERFDIKSMPIDSLLGEFSGRVDFLKVDVEGAEPLVFRGAKELIRTNPQLNIVMEWAPAQIRAAGFDLLQFGNELAGMGLKFWLISGPEFLSVEWSELLTRDYLSGFVMSQTPPISSAGSSGG